MTDFRQIVGHKELKKHFKLSLTSKQVSHAYLIYGEDDSGKMMLAKAFAMALQCKELTNEDSCGICTSCKQFKSANHPDVIYVERLKNKYEIGVDDIREQVNNNIVIKPYSSPYKIYIIDEAQMLSVQAQNALLKTLEEPPGYAIVLLITNNLSSILETIQSRCIMLQTKPVEKDLIKVHLMSEHQIPDYQAELSAIFAQGNVGKAINYASSEKFIETKNDILNILKHIDEKENYELIDFANNLTKEKDNVLNVLDLILLWYRDLLMYKVTKNPNLLLYKKEISSISKIANMISYEGIQDILKSIEETKIKIEANVNMETTLQLMLFKIKENSND